METRKLNLIFEKSEDKITQLSHFGWEVVSKSEIRGNVITVTLKRNSDTPHLKALRKLEKQYKLLLHLPISFYVYFVLSIGCFVPTFILMPNWYAYFALVPALFFLFIVLFQLTVFLILKPSKKKLMKELFLEADCLIGKDVSKPYKQNLLPPTERSFIIKRKIYHKL